MARTHTRTQYTLYLTKMTGVGGRMAVDYNTLVDAEQAAGMLQWARGLQPALAPLATPYITWKICAYKGAYITSETLTYGVIY